MDPIYRTERSADDSTIYSIVHDGLTIIVDVYDTGEVVLLVEKDGQKRSVEI